MATKKTKQERLHQRVMKAGKARAGERYEKHYHPSNPHHKKHIVIDAILGALVFLLAVFSLWLLFFYTSAIAHEQIDLSVAPSAFTIRSGDELSYTIRLENNSGSRLDEATLSIPKNTGFVFSRSLPEADQNIILLGTVDNGEKVEVEVFGTTLVSVTDHLRLTTVLNYKSGFSGTKQKLASEAVVVNGSLLTIAMNLPETIIANQTFPFTITYKNESKTTNFDQVTILPNFPPALTLEEASREFDEELNGWTLETVGSFDAGTIEGRATINTADLDIALIGARIFSAPLGKPLLQDTASLEVPVRLPNVETSFSASEQRVSPGNAISTSFTVENKETFSITDLRIKYKLNPALFAVNRLPGGLDPQGFYTQSIADLLTSNDSTTVSADLFIRESIIPELAFGQGAPKVLIDAELLYIGENDQEVVLPVNPLNLALNSDLRISAFARYYSVEGDQIGRGPLPPVVGETTKYWVFIELENSIHTVNDITMRASLPAGLTFTGKSSVTAGKALVYNQGSNSLTWKVDSIPDYKSDFNQDRYGAAFEVAFTPSADQVGKSIVLLREIEVQGRDTSTGAVIIDSAPLVTNSLTNDAFAQDTGEVAL